MSLSKPRIPLTAFRERVSLPGERSLCWALAVVFSSVRVWQYLKQHPAHVDALINNFLKHVIADSDASDWQKKQRRRDLRNWMRFCPQPGTCPRGHKACARCETSYWTSDKVLHVWRREARATRLKHSPTSIKLRFAKYLADDLCHQGIVPGRAAVVDCSCCSGSYRADLPGVVKWRLVTPCGHWCCGACEERLVQEAAREERPLLCPDCRAPVITGYQKEWPGQVVVSEGDGASICDSDD